MTLSHQLRGRGLKAGRTSPAPAWHPVGSQRALTLLELLAVLAILGLLASMTLPVAHRTKVQTKTRQARLEMARLVAAVTDYEATYGRFPISFEAGSTADALREDLTFGGVLQETRTWVAGPGYFTNNSELMAPLLDLEYYGDGAPTINRGHVRNPQRVRFLEANQVGGTNVVPGIGRDGQYRDPWGSPYVVTLDLNRDGRARDAMYSKPVVSEDPSDPRHGLYQLDRGADSQGLPVFEALARVTVWSAGPDRHLNTNEKANAGVNRDNLLSWDH
ncbi:MAG TPA: prepilin-type N-terminal cleavage/methylation domain-containing protein [Verrucomicrobiae bacterium]|nr:prepilin-type N-terminal cleavage/methylation domain-containing protein [Verrucomicrobiae bacterium]